MAVGVQDPLALHCSETCFGKPVRPPPSAKMTEASAREAVAELWPSPGNLFREARRASPQRQNNGARACVRRRGFATAVAEASAVARKVVSGSPTGQLPAPKLRKRARATRPLRGCRGSFGRRPESFFGKPDGPDPSVKTTGTSFRATRRARPKPKPSTILRTREKWHATRPGRVSANPKP